MVPPYKVPVYAELSPYPYVLPSRERLLEVVDNKDRPLLIMPGEQALNQHLPHRKVRVALRDTKGRLLLVRPSLADGSAGQWTLPGTRTRAGESREDAALRALAEILGITQTEVRGTERREPSPACSGKTAFFTATLEEGAARMQTVGEGEVLFVDNDELQGLATHFPDLLMRELVQSIESGYLAAVLEEARSNAHNS